MYVNLAEQDVQRAYDFFHVCTEAARAPTFVPIRLESETMFGQEGLYRSRR